MYQELGYVDEKKNKARLKVSDKHCLVHSYIYGYI